ncbi:flavin reductase family protein [Haloplanus sp. GCM10025708]|uniref:flavin reductase family protein n=1 Tax=Haloferacaceae TaxID=1644056 RepID=UPI00360C19E3
MVEHERAALTERERARIVKSAVSPRPIAWISTRSVDGVDNLAPYSSYNYVSSSEPVVLFNSPNEDHGGLKDTARNAVETGEFAVNVVTEELLERMDRTSASAPPGESEFDLADVDRAECERIDAPRVAAAVVTMECSFFDSMRIHDRLVVFGEVEHFHVSDDVLTEGKIDMRKMPTVGRLGGPYYTVSDPVEFERQH